MDHYPLVVLHAPAPAVLLPDEDHQGLDLDAVAVDPHQESLDLHQDVLVTVHPVVAVKAVLPVSLANWKKSFK